MHKGSHKDYSCLVSILDSIVKIEKYSEGFTNADEFYNNSISFDASMMNIIVIGGMVEKLSDTFFEQYATNFDWGKVRSFRTIIAHNYFGIDAEDVWQIIKNKLPALYVAIKNIIEIKQST